MRLSNHEVEIIKKVVFSFDKDADIKLFGSRVYDDKKGGDIDIFIQTQRDMDFEKKLQILADFELMGIERKVDMIVKTPRTKQQLIFDTAEKEGISL